MTSNPLMRPFAMLVAVLFCAIPAQSQEGDASERTAVLATVHAFFDTMAAKDAAGAERILVPQARFYAIRQQDGKVIRSFTTEDHLNDLRTMKQNVTERIWNPEVRVRGALATVWAPYDFWADGKLVGCGIDAFQLLKIDGAWRLAGGSYQVEAKCEPSPLGPLKKEP